MPNLIDLNAGTDESLELTITDPDSGEPLEGGISGWTFRALLKTSINDVDAAAVLELDAAAFEITDDVACTVTVTIPKALTADLPRQLLYMDVRAKDAADLEKVSSTTRVQMLVPVTRSMP